MKKTLLLAISLLLALQAYSQKIFLTGDSHVSAKVYPQEVKNLVEKARPSASVSFWGKGSAGFYTFNENPSYMGHIFNAAPDILIVHLGTNGCYNVPFDKEKTLADLETFYSTIREKLPDCKMVFVTPFYNKNKNEKGAWKVNEKTRYVSDTIIEFLEDKPDTFVIDNNADAGTIFVDRKGLIREDNIHLTVKGYELLGTQVAEKLLEIEDLW